MPMPTHVNGKTVRTGAWTAEEDQLLADWQKEYGNRWSSVSKKINGRTGQQCAQRWRHKVNPNIRKEKWTQSEDQLLASLYKEHGSAWAEISRQLKGRTDQQCMGRWRRHLDPAIKKEAWRAKEDAELTELHIQFGSQWATIAKYLPGRTAQQCRARWHQMDPEGSSTPLRGCHTASKTACKSKRAKSRRHSAYSESDADDLEISDSDEPEEAPEIEGDYEYASQAQDMKPDRLASGAAFRQAADGNASQGSDWTNATFKTAGREGRQGWFAQDSEAHLRDSPSNYHSSAVDEEGEMEDPNEVDTESPPFISSEAYQNAATADTQLLNGMAYVRRSPSYRVPSPHVQGYQPNARGKSSTPARPRAVRAVEGEQVPTPEKQYSPALSEQTAWESSPIDNVLRLFKSPEARNNTNFLQSPSMQGIATPDWARRDGLPPPSTTKTKRQRNMVENAKAAETPSKRGPVARRLDVESALRPSASERMRQSQRSHYAPSFLCSPAKKLRSSIRRPDTDVRLASMTDKENFACDALQQLSMAASLVDRLSDF